MKLTMGDRFALLSIMPAKGNMVTLRMVVDARTKLSPSEEEIKACGIVAKPNGDVKWDDEKYTADIEFGDVALSIIRGALREADEKQLLTPNHMHVFEMLVEERPE